MTSQMQRDVVELMKLAAETRADVRYIKESVPDMKRRIHALELFRARSIGALTILTTVVTIGLPVIGWVIR